MDGTRAAFIAACFAFCSVWLVLASRGAAFLWAGYRGVAMTWPTIYAAAAGLFVLVVCLSIGNARAAEATLTDAHVKQALIHRSVEIYVATVGSCPCPWNLDVAGKVCGGRSAWSKEPGGQSPLCVPDDITAEMINIFRGEGH